MDQLTARDRELVALGAAVASNCIPCVEYHIPKASEAGLTDAELTEVLALADKVRQVPADKVLDAAQALVSGSAPVGKGNPCAKLSGQAEKKGACC